LSRRTLTKNLSRKTLKHHDIGCSEKKNTRFLHNNTDPYIKLSSFVQFHSSGVCNLPCNEHELESTLDILLSKAQPKIQKKLG